MSYRNMQCCTSKPLQLKMIDSMTRTWKCLQQIRQEQLIESATNHATRVPPGNDDKLYGPDDTMDQILPENSSCTDITSHYSWHAFHHHTTTTTTKTTTTTAAAETTTTTATCVLQCDGWQTDSNKLQHLHSGWYPNLILTALPSICKFFMVFHPFSKN